MKTLWICVVLQSLQLPIFAQVTFGTSLLTNSKLCHEWTCLNTKLGLPNTLPPRDQYEAALKSLLAQEWHTHLDTVLEVCYNNRTRTYTNTCPGQALMHCVVDNLIENCPESIERKDDACTPVSCIAGLKYMFSQSRYKDFDKNLPKDRRPSWFLQNYFDTKCCDLQPLFNSSVMAECGLSEFIHYYDHPPQHESVTFDSYKNHATSPSSVPVRIKLAAPKKTPPSSLNSVKIATMSDFSTTPATDVDIKNLDPLDCCDMTRFIEPSWRTECDFGLTWDNQSRLTIGSIIPTTEPTTSTPDNSEESTRNDVKIVPLSCESETCVFNKLNILSPTGDVNLDSFTKLLDNFTLAHPEFNKAKARVITECMRKPLLGYDEACQINKVLACTFDVLSEYCPYTDRKHDPCKDPKSNMMCQISSSKFRPKSRRSFCSLPNFVPVNALTECGVVSLSQMKYVAQRTGKKQYTTKPNLGCQQMTNSTSCLLDKMGVLNRYKFLDYFKMKDRVRRFSTQPEWSALTDVYISAFTNKPMYGNHCNSPKQLLNVLDTMLMTCPASLRKQSAQCNRFYAETMKAAPYTSNATKLKLDQLINHFHHVLLPVTVYHPNAIPTNTPKLQYKPLYNYGVLSSGSVPPVSIIDIKPTAKKPLMILPVYMHMYNNGARYPTPATPYRSPLLRSGPIGQKLDFPSMP